MAEKLKWQRDAVEGMEEMSLRDLLDFAFSCQEPDDYDGGFTLRGTWYARRAREAVYERLETLKII